MFNSYTFLPHSYLGSLIVKLLLAHWKPNQGSDFFSWFQSHISKGQCNHDIECIRYRKAYTCPSLPHLLQPLGRYHLHLPSITQVLLLGRYRLYLKGLRQGDAWTKGTSRRGTWPPCRWLFALKPLLKFHPYGRKRRRTKEPLNESERGEWKSWLKIQHSEN